MTRKRSAILFGIMTAFTVAFLAWSGRQFYIRPGLLFDHRIPPEAEEVIRKWNQESGGVPPARMSFRRFRAAIGSSSGAEVQDAAAILESDTEIRVIHDGREWWFTLRDGNWLPDHPTP